MKSVVTQLAQYKSVHLHPKNITSHFIGIPLIVLSVTLLFNFFSVEILIENLFRKPITVHVTLAMGIFAFIALYYVMLNRQLALGMIIYIVVNFLAAELLSHNDSILKIALALFVIGWVFQMIGHYYERAKPAFVDDLNQLIIGPFFLMAELYFMLGLLPKLQQEVDDLAVEKRQRLDEKNNKLEVNTET